MHILIINRIESPLQIYGKVAGCVVRTRKTFQGTHILGASRGLLCDSSAVLFLYRYRECLWTASVLEEAQRHRGCLRLENSSTLYASVCLTPDTASVDVASSETVTYDRPLLYQRSTHHRHTTVCSSHHSRHHYWQQHAATATIILTSCFSSLQTHAIVGIFIKATLHHCNPHNLLLLLKKISARCFSVRISYVFCALITIGM